MLKFISAIIAKLIGLVFLLHLAFFYLRLGFFTLYVWVLGLLLAVWFTKPEWNRKGRRLVALILIVVGYALSVFVIWTVFIGQKTHREYTMTWIDKGVDNQFKEAEVVLQFVEYPGNIMGIYSNDLSNYLHNLPGNEVKVTYEITSDFCAYVDSTRPR